MCFVTVWGENNDNPLFLFVGLTFSLYFYILAINLTNWSKNRLIKESSLFYILTN